MTLNSNFQISYIDIKNQGVQQLFRHVLPLGMLKVVFVVFHFDSKLKKIVYMNGIERNNKSNKLNYKNTFDYNQQLHIFYTVFGNMFSLFPK